jgi:hypothetical protein
VKQKVVPAALVAMFAVSVVVVPAEACWRRCSQPYCCPAPYYPAPYSYYSAPSTTYVAPTTGPVAKTTVPPVEKITVAPKEPKFAHLQTALDELREAKEDVRDLKGGVTFADREKMLGALDAAVDHLKKCIEAGGEKAIYVKPHPKVYETYPDFKHLRHAHKVLKLAKEQLRMEPQIPEDLRIEAVRLLDHANEQIEKALEHVKENKK